MRERRPFWAVAVASLGFMVAGLLVFARGFFPVKPFLPGYSAPSSTGTHSRLVFVLVDALRSDFVFGQASNMPFVLIASGHGLPYTAIAQAPTVTLPRLKALTTGSNPTFLDAMLNIAEDDDTATLENVDSWVRQLAVGSQNESRVQPRKRLVFLGDDTWLRLFPRRWFAFAEGVSSFFVADTTTVDTNVTRHLDWLLDAETPEWDHLILHFLGLDHVGHLGGPTSPFLEPKLKEMDAVVERLYRDVERRDKTDGESTLLVLVGDHGMSETGNHGGSSEGEVSAALLLASPSFKRNVDSPRPGPGGMYRHHKVINQIDLVPTLATLLGLGIPKNSMGRVIESAWHALPQGPTDLPSILRRNADQLDDVLKAVDSNGARQLQCDAVGLSLSDCPAKAKLSSVEESKRFTQAVQERLLNTFGDHDLSSMAIGLTVLLASVIGFTTIVRGLDLRLSPAGILVSAAFIAYLASFFATTFLEEEHEIWFFFSTTAFLLVSASASDGSTALWGVVGAASIRALRAWSHNGQKSGSNASIGPWLARSPVVALWLATLTITFHVAIAFRTLVQAASLVSARRLPVAVVFRRALTFAVLVTLVIVHAALVALSHLVKAQKHQSLQSTLEELGLGAVSVVIRTSYATAGASLALVKMLEWGVPATERRLDSVKLAIISNVLASLAQTHKVPLFVLLWQQYFVLRRLESNPLVLSGLIVALQKVAFFAFGGSNSLSTVDLSQAYNGIDSYDVRIVSLLTFASNFAGPIYWSLAATALNRRVESHKSHFAVTSLFHACSILVLAMSATHFRHHLFTFTVFSPALLFHAVWATWVHLGSDIALAQIMQ